MNEINVQNNTASSVTDAWVAPLRPAGWSAREGPFSRLRGCELVEGLSGNKGEVPNIVIIGVKSSRLINK